MTDSNQPQDKFLQSEEDPTINERLQQAVRAVIDQQLAEKDPPDALETFERLLEEGFSEAEVYNLIGQLVSLEVGEMLNGGAINLPRYQAALAELPKPFAEPRAQPDED